MKFLGLFIVCIVLAACLFFVIRSRKKVVDKFKTAAEKVADTIKENEELLKKLKHK